MKIGDTLYHFDQNRRVYTTPKDGGWGTIIYSEHFHPLKIVGENRVSWLLEWHYKANKKDPRRQGFYTAEQMDDHIWVNDHRHRIRDLLDRADAAQLRRVAEILGYYTANGQSAGAEK